MLIMIVYGAVLGEGLQKKGTLRNRMEIIQGNLFLHCFNRSFLKVKKSIHYVYKITYMCIQNRITYVLEL